MDEITWYPFERFAEEHPPPNHITTLIEIQHADADDLISQQRDPSLWRNSLDKIDAMCEWISTLPQFHNLGGFIRRGILDNDHTRPIILVEWTYPDQPPPNWLELITYRLQLESSSVTVTDIMLDNPPNCLMQGRFEVSKWRLPPDHGEEVKKVVFAKAFADFEEYCLSTDSGRDAHDGAGDLLYFGRGWCLRRASTTGEVVGIGNEFCFINQWDDEEGEHRFKDPAKENWWPEIPADLYETGFNKPLNAMQKQGMVVETVHAALTGRMWRPKRSEIAGN